MDFRSTRSKALQRFIEENDDRGIRRDLVGRVRRILTALQVAQDMGDLQGPPGWRVHKLTGDRAGTCSISVFGNWRITFDLDGTEITNLDLEDYH